MANPQTENGHIRIPNGLFESLIAARLNGCEYAVVLAIIRKTDGWNKDGDKISHSQIQQMTGLKSRSHIMRSLKALEDRNIVIATHKHGLPSIYALNKDFGNWLGCAVLDTCMQKDTCIDNNSGHVSNNIQDMYAKGHRTCMQSDTHNKQIKTNTNNHNSADDSSLLAFSKRYDSLQPGTVTSAVKDRLKSYLEKYGAQELDVVFDAAADMKAMGKLSNPLGFIRNVLEKRRVERDSQPKAPDKSIYGVDITPHNPNGLPPHCRINTGKGWLDPDEALERGFMDKALYDKCMAELEAITKNREAA
jgi:phage replication O-like protein O